MLNLFITYNCNFNCNYCFIHGFKGMYPDYIGQDEFARLCAWLEKNRIYSIGILGGEPTLHSRLVPMLRELNRAGVSVALFTNGLFPKKLIGPLAETVSNFVVNYNDPSMYTDRQWSQLQDTLGTLHAAGVSVSFSKNFSKGWLRFEYILEACAKFGISHIRYDISRPNPVKANNYFNLEESKELTDVILEFARKCRSRGIDTGMDCCLPFCYFEKPSLDYLRTVSMKFNGICHPSVDIQTDLSASYCIPMQNIGVPDVTVFAGEMELFYHFSNEVRRLREIPSNERCASCDLFGQLCQGGCLALKRGVIAD